MSTGEGHTYTHTWDFQALTGVPGHAVTKNRSGGPIMVRALGVVCLSVAARDSGASSTTLRLNAPLDAQSLPRHCGVIGAICGTL